jgi:hypothetical protein
VTIFESGVDLNNPFDEIGDHGDIQPRGYGDVMSSLDNAQTNKYNTGKSVGMPQAFLDYIMGQVTQPDDRAVALKRRLEMWRK